MSLEAASPKGRLRLDYTGTNVTTATWVLVGPMPLGVFTMAEIYDSSSQVMEMKIDNVAGAAAGNIPMFIMPGGNGRITMRNDGGSSAGLNLYVRAVSASATTGQFIINFW